MSKTIYKTKLGTTVIDDLTDGDDVVRVILTKLPKVIPSDAVLVHLGAKRTRAKSAWLQKPDDRIMVCDCGWAPELGRHFRIRRVTAPDATD